MDINRHIEALNWGKEPKGLYEPIAYALSGGGKRLRPMLALLACDLCGGQTDDVLPAALALEVFHNFTLLHDDVMDHASVRRSRPSVNVKYNDNTAILSGDQMLIEAYKLIAKVPTDKQATVLSLFNEMATGVCEGQQLDVDFETMPLDKVSLEDYINMICLKTSVLLAYALKIGAYISEATEVQEQALYDFGIHLGLAFQIQDDVLDVYGDEATFGKAIGGDICEGKKTFVFLTARDNSDENTRQSLFEAMLLPSGTAEQRKEKITRVVSLYNHVRAREKAEATIAEHTVHALKQLEAFPDSEAKQTLISLAEQLVSRKS